MPAGGTRSREAAAAVALEPAYPLGSRDQLEQAQRRRETELAVLETGFNKCFGTSTTSLQAESSWRREAERSLKMAGVVCRVTRLVLKAKHSLSRLVCGCDQKLSLHSNVNCPFSTEHLPGMPDFLTECLLIGPLLPQVIPWEVSGKIWMM